MAGSLYDDMSEMSGSPSDSMMPNTSFEKLPKSLRLPIALGTIALGLVCLASTMWQYHPKIVEGELLQLDAINGWKTWLGGFMCHKVKYTKKPGYLSGNAPGVGGNGKEFHLGRAMNYCAMNWQCTGVTCAGGNGMVHCTLRRGPDVQSNKHSLAAGENTYEKSSVKGYVKTTSWKKYSQTYLAGYASGVGGGGEKGDLETMQGKCRQNANCGGVTCGPTHCTLRGKGPLQESEVGESTYLYLNA